LAAVGGDYRRATKVLETAYAQTPHPDLAAAYLRVRHGDSTGDRVARARALARAAPHDPESMLTVGRAALEDHDLRAARAAIAPLLASGSPNGRPTRRVCLLMADIETADGNQGAVREWLSRAARAPSDKAWVADGVISDRWAPVSPSGALDAFVWRTPDERLTALPEPEPIEPAPPPPSLPPRVEAAAPAEAPLQPAPEPPSAAETLAPPIAVELIRSASASPPPNSAARAGVVVDPDSMAPDDPGPGEPERPRRRSWIYADD
jgi:HemY protein